MAVAAGGMALLLSQGEAFPVWLRGVWWCAWTAVLVYVGNDALNAGRRTLHIPAGD